MFKSFHFFPDMHLFRGCLFLLLINISATWGLDDEQCSEDDDFAKAVAHGIHSIKINNIQFYFDKNFTRIDNGIPTINTNLNDIEHEVLDNAPNFQSDFKEMGLQEMDFVMSQNGPDFLFRGANALEKIGHSLHMNEMWAEAGKVYQYYIENPPSCQCLQENLIKKHLKKMASILRADDRTENAKPESQKYFISFKPNIQKRDTERNYNLYRHYNENIESRNFHESNLQKRNAERNNFWYEQYIQDLQYKGNEAQSSIETKLQKRDAERNGAWYEQYIENSPNQVNDGNNPFAENLHKRDADRNSAWYEQYIENSQDKEFGGKMQKRDAERNGAWYEQYIERLPNQVNEGKKPLAADLQKRDVERNSMLYGAYINGDKEKLKPIEIQKRDAERNSAWYEQYIENPQNQVNIQKRDTERNRILYDQYTKDYQNNLSKNTHGALQKRSIPDANHVDYNDSLQGPEQWGYFKHLFLKSMLDQKKTKYLARYLYCKINNQTE
jgi:hypothetical protein